MCVCIYIYIYAIHFIYSYCEVLTNTKWYSLIMIFVTDELWLWSAQTAKAVHLREEAGRTTWEGSSRN